MNKLENLDKILEEIEQLKMANSIVKRLWTVFDSYELERTIKEKGFASYELINDIHNYFDFDDSE